MPSAPATRKRSRRSRRSRASTSWARSRSYGWAVKPIAAIAAEDARQARRRRIPAHQGAAGGVVDRELAHAGEPADAPLGEPDAGGAGEVLEQERRLLEVARVAHHRALDGRVVVDRQLAEKVRHELAPLGRELRAQAVVVAPAARHDGTRHGLAAGTAERPRLPVEHEAPGRASGLGQATVEAGRHATNATALQQAAPRPAPSGDHP